MGAEGLRCISYPNINKKMHFHELEMHFLPKSELDCIDASKQSGRRRDHGNPINRIFFLMLNFLSKEFYKIHDKTTFHVATYIVSDYHIILLKYFSYDAEKNHFI